MNPTTVPSTFNDFLLPVTNVYNYNTRNAARCNFYRPQIRTNYGNLLSNTPLQCYGKVFLPA